MLQRAGMLADLGSIPLSYSGFVSFILILDLAHLFLISYSHDLLPIP